MTADELVEHLLNLAGRVGKVVDALPDTRMGRHIRLLLRRHSASRPSGFSICNLQFSILNLQCFIECCLRNQRRILYQTARLFTVAPIK